MKATLIFKLGSFVTKMGILAVSLATAPLLQAQDAVVVPDNVLFKAGGFLYHFQAGQAHRVDQDLRISDRVTVRANGSVLKDGNVFTVGDGQMVFPDGRLENTPAGFSPGVNGL